MHRRMILYQQTWRQSHYHCCGLRFIARAQAVKHLCQRHKAPSWDAAHDVVASLHDHGALADCAACAEGYVAQRPQRRSALRHLPEEADATPPRLLPGERALAWAILLRAARDAQGRCGALGRGEQAARYPAEAQQFLQEENPVFTLCCDVLDRDPATMRQRLLGRSFIV